MTWKEFKDSVEEQGVRDNTEIGYIDWLGHYKPEVDRSEDDSEVDIT